MRARRGTGLAESLVTLALAGVVMGAAGRGLSQHLRLRRERDDQARADEIVQVVRDVLRAEVDHAAPDPDVLGDTAVQFASERGAVVACDLAADRLTLPATAAWWSAPRAGDSLAILDTASGVEWRTEVRSTTAVRGSARCRSGGTRLALAMPPPASVPVFLLPARVWRLVRYVAYRASDGAWWLGERSCRPACTSAQPIAGPLVAPGQGGLRLGLVLAPDGRPVALDVSVRAVVGRRLSALSARIPFAIVP